jgi:hypothetical protein
MNISLIPTTQVRLWLFLGAMLVVGVLAIVSASYITSNTSLHLLAELLKEVGVALMIAAFLGLTVDRLLKLEMARDVFLAAFRYVLPDELKEEVGRIISYKFICTEHRTVIEIVEIAETEFVRVTVSTERILKNISRHAEALGNHFALDEWGFPEHRTMIGECSMELDQEVLKGANFPDYEDEGMVGQKTDERSIARSGTAKLITRGSEVHRNNGEIMLGFDAPTVRPSVDIRIPDGFKYALSFGVPGERVVESKIAKSHRLEGAQFPGQATRLRWWKELQQ